MNKSRQMKIRKATKKDLKKLLELDKEVNKEIKWWFPIKSSEFSRLIKRGLVYIAEQDKKIVGYQNGGIKEKQLLLEDIYVKKNFRNRGVAKKLSKKFILDWKPKFKEARIDCPTRLKKFYEKLGFKQTAVIMVKKI